MYQAFHVVYLQFTVCRFSTRKCSYGIQVFEGHLVKGIVSDFRCHCVLTEHSVKRFTVRIILRNTDHLCIGFSLPYWPKWSAMYFEYQSWLLRCASATVIESGSWNKPGPGARAVASGAIVCVEKDPFTRSLRFLVNGQVLMSAEQSAQRAGWRATDLDQTTFDSLVGAIQMSKDDQVEICTALSQ